MKVIYNVLYIIPNEQVNVYNAIKYLIKRQYIWYGSVNADKSFYEYESYPELQLRTNDTSDVFELLLLMF